MKRENRPPTADRRLLFERLNVRTFKRLNVCRLLSAVCRLLIALLVLLCNASVVQAGDVRPFTSLRRKGYRVASGFYRVGMPMPAWDSRDSLALASGVRLRRIRSFEAGGTGYALCVDVETLRTFVVTEDGLRSGAVEDRGRGSGVGGQGISEDDAVRESPYERALRQYAYAPMMGEDREGVAFTVDLCPSNRPWDRDLFDALQEMGTVGHPLPVAVCASGAWVRHHGPEFEQLCAWHRQGELDVTFVNHSDTHPVGEHGDFLNSGDVDFEAEVLNAEVALLMRGAVPSSFFRFPGLVHSTARLDALVRYGLIPVDADHWPGRDHVATDRLPRGILLLHGNGNERAGVAWLFEMVRRTGLKEKLRKGTCRVLSLSEYAGE